jgi:hypothetical protein
MGLTSDRNDRRLGHGSDAEPRPQQEVYLILSEEERARGFVRPVRRSYRHTGAAGPQYPLRDLTDGERERYAGEGYVKFEPYPADGRRALGRFWTQGQLDSGGCGTVTTMGVALAETYAASPGFYGATYCPGCRMHRPVGADGEFTWLTESGEDTSELVGT